MYTNPSNLIKTLIRLLDKNADTINRLIHVYEPRKGLTVLEGMRPTLPVDAYPSLEIEPTTSANEWATTRSQRPRYNFQLTLTVKTDNHPVGLEYITTLTTILTEIMTSPENLQLRVINESRWTPNEGLVPTYIMDSLVEDATYNANKEGTIRTAEFGWFALIHEPFPDSKFALASATPQQFGELEHPVEIRPNVYEVPS